MSIERLDMVFVNGALDYDQHDDRLMCGRCAKDKGLEFGPMRTEVGRRCRVCGAKTTGATGNPEHAGGWIRPTALEAMTEAVNES